MNSLKHTLGSNRRISFATPYDLTSILDAESGSLSLFSVFNDTSKRVKVVIDKSLMEKEVLAFHPNYRGLTSFISSSDAIKFLDSLDCEYIILNIPTKNKEFYKEQESSMVKTLAYKM